MSSLLRDKLHLVFGLIDFLFLPSPTSTWKSSATHSKAFLWPTQVGALVRGIVNPIWMDFIFYSWAMMSSPELRSLEHILPVFKNHLLPAFTVPAPLQNTLPHLSY